jgi:hypothetical protein
LEGIATAATGASTSIVKGARIVNKSLEGVAGTTNVSPASPASLEGVTGTSNVSPASLLEEADSSSESPASLRYVARTTSESPASIIGEDGFGNESAASLGEGDSVWVIPDM